MTTMRITGRAVSVRLRANRCASAIWAGVIYGVNF
jgi:hypothetical protein